jgi:heme exporter protein A
VVWRSRSIGDKGGNVMVAAVSLRDVSLRFGTRWVLARLSLELPQHAKVLLTGPNGAGKTTLLRLMATALRPSLGELSLFGVPAYPNPDAVRPRVGLVTHQNHLYEDLTARQNLRLVARLTGQPRTGIGAIIERVGLAADADRSVRHFSAGMKRRLCIGRLLLRGCDLALLDEPFAQLDPEGVELVERLVGEMHADGITIVLSTHDVERGERVCDVHLRLRHGRQVGGLQELAA